MLIDQPCGARRASSFSLPLCDLSGSLTSVCALQLSSGCHHCASHLQQLSLWISAAESIRRSLHIGSIDRIALLFDVPNPS